MIKEIDEKSPANFRSTKNGIASYFGNRNIMMLIDIHSFCKKRRFLLHFRKRFKKNNCKNPKRNRIFKR